MRKIEYVQLLYSEEHRSHMRNGSEDELVVLHGDNAKEKAGWQMKLMVVLKTRSFKPYLYHFYRTSTLLTQFVLYETFI